MRPWSLPWRIVQNRLGLVPRPSWTTYLVCNRCNARCQMCDSWKLPRGDEMTPDEVEAVFAKIGRLDIVRLSGGKPFLRADLLEVAEAVMRAARPGILHVTSNGSLPDRVRRLAQDFSRPRRLYLMISLDGLPAEWPVKRLGERVDIESERITPFESGHEGLVRDFESHSHLVACSLPGPCAFNDGISLEALKLVLCQGDRQGWVPDEGDVRRYRSTLVLRNDNRADEQTNREQLWSAMLALRILEIEGVKDTEKRRFLEDLDVAEAEALRVEFDRVDCGVDTTIEVECPECFMLQDVDLLSTSASS